MHLENAEFLTRLKELFAKRSEKSKNTVFVTQKRLTYHDNSINQNGEVQMQDVANDATYPCLVRASNGKDIKFSTTVVPKDLPTFHASYSTILKSSLTALRPKKKDKSKKAGAGSNVQVPKIVGPKRGAGRRKRVAKQKAKQKALVKLGKKTNTTTSTSNTNNNNTTTS